MGSHSGDVKAGRTWRVGLGNLAHVWHRITLTRETALSQYAGPSVYTMPLRPAWSLTQR